MTTRPPIVVGNWKMNLGGRDGLEVAELLSERIASHDEGSPQLVILPPFTTLPLLQQFTAEAGTRLEYGAQDLSPNAEGAFTGDISAGMLADLGCRYVLTGHSERRQHHHETDQIVNAKTLAAVRCGLTPVVCVGEGLDVRRSGAQVEHTVSQVQHALDKVDAADVANLMIAYEPVWAIGTGQVATPDDAQEVCAAIRNHILDVFGEAASQTIRVLYGGSVKATTSASIVAQPDIDGTLVGGASLDPVELESIWRAAHSAPTSRGA